MINRCYYCGCEATTAEHAPPRAIFPELKDSPDGRNYRKNPIKVPSCEEHNTEKSKEDEYLLYVLAMSLPSNDLGKSQFLTKVRRAYERRPKLLERLLLKPQGVVVHDTVSDAWHKTIAIQPEEHRLIGIFTCIAKALYFYEKACPWLGHVSVFIEFMLSFKDIEQIEQQRLVVQQLDTTFSDVPFKGENPDVFSYQFVEFEGSSFVRLHFYGSTRVTAAYVA